MAKNENSEICLACGLCCQGQIFTTVSLQPEEVESAKTWPVDLVMDDERPRFRQPCGCYRKQRCTIYADRPKACVSYSCRVLEQLRDGSITNAEALETIGHARKLIQKIESQLDPDVTRTIWSRVSEEWDLANMAALRNEGVISEDALLALGALRFILDRKFKK